MIRVIFKTDHQNPNLDVMLPFLTEELGGKAYQGHSIGTLNKVIHVDCDVDDEEEDDIAEIASMASKNIQTDPDFACSDLWVDDIVAIGANT
jgi:hypothetical protein